MAPPRGAQNHPTIKSDVLPPLERELGGSVGLTLGGIAPEERDFGFTRAREYQMSEEGASSLFR
jgi:hypothetical protein